MKPKTNPLDDSLISGIPTQGQSSQQQEGVGSAASQPIDLPVNPATGYDSTPPMPIQPANVAMGTQEQPVSPYVSTGMPQPETFAPPVQPEPATAPVNTSAFTAPQAPVNMNQVQPTPAVETSQPAPAPSFVPQPTSPFDTPPAPAQQAQPVQNPVNLQGSIAEEKSRKKAPVFLVILLILVVAVLGVVGYLAYQNYILDKNTPPETSQLPLKTPTIADTNPYAGYTLFKGSVMAVEFMAPLSWKTEETEDPDLGNQKMIRSTSPDFLYEGDAIASGYEFRVGPVSDLTKKYTSFEAFSAEENADNSYTLRTINGIKWLVKADEAKTLLATSPLVITLYTAADQAASATEIFTKILNSFKINSAVSVTPGVTQGLLPTSAPLE